MTTRELGGTAVEVPVIGQGTWRMEADDADDCLLALRTGLDLGLTHVDTAEMYGDGRIETLVGRAIEGRREEVFLVSKVLPDHASRAGVRRACEASLRRLRVERLDLYLLHWPSDRHPIAETIGALDDLVDAGMVRFLGVSNFDAEKLREADRACTRRRIACNQVLYHLGDRRIERDVLPACRRLGIAVVGYSPFAGGSFAPDRGAGGRTLAGIARKHGKTARQVALAFLSRPPLFAIPKAARADHVRENAGADFTLDAEDLAAIDRAFPIRGPAVLPWA